MLTYAKLCGSRGSQFDEDRVWAIDSRISPAGIFELA